MVKIINRSLGILLFIASGSVFAIGGFGGMGAGLGGGFGMGGSAVGAPAGPPAGFTPPACVATGNCTAADLTGLLPPGLTLPTGGGTPPGFTPPAGGFTPPAGGFTPPAGFTLPVGFPTAP